MKTTRRFATLMGLFLLFAALGVVRSRAQSLFREVAGGKVTLPFQVRWGSMILPAGDYLWQFEHTADGFGVVEVRGMAKKSPHGIVLAQVHDSTSATKSALVCTREGNAGVVRALVMPAIGKSAYFVLPHSAKLIADQRNGSTNTQLAEAPVMENVPVEVNGK